MKLRKRLASSYSLKTKQLSSYLKTNMLLVRVDYHILFYVYKSSVFTMVVGYVKLFLNFMVSDTCVMPGYSWIPDVYISSFAPSQCHHFFLRKGEKIEYLGIFRCASHGLQDNIGLFRSGNLKSVVFHVIQNDPIFEMTPAHLAAHRRPFHHHTILQFLYIEMGVQPRPQALDVNVSYSTDTIARRNQRICCLTRLEADPAAVFRLRENGGYFSFI